MRDEQLCRLRRALGNKADGDTCAVLVEDLRDLLAKVEEAEDLDDLIDDLLERPTA